jgi:hypothetical protein
MSGRSHYSLLIGLMVVGLLGLGFIGAALPFFRLDEMQYGTLWPRRWWVLLHISTGIVALFTAPVQLWLSITESRPAVRRRVGTIFLAAVGVSSMAAFYLAFHTDRGVVYGFGLTGLAIAWFVTSGFAYTAMRRRLYEQHKEWMIRSYVVTNSFVAFGGLMFVLEGVGVGTLNERITIASWFCWAIPLLVTEAWLQGKKILAVRAG